MAAQGRDVKLDPARVAGYRNFGTKLWNATRFAEMNGVFATPTGQPQPDHTVNRWIMGETARARLALDEALAAYRFNDAAQGMYAFVWGKLCDWYVEFAKPLFDGEHADETRATMAWVIEQAITMLHPIMPFVTEEIWALTGARAKMLVHGDWPAYGAELIDEAADRWTQFCSHPQVPDLLRSLRDPKLEYEDRQEFLGELADATEEVFAEDCEWRHEHPEDADGEDESVPF